ncbi:Anti-anti-sigma regulatory factor (antagonist of anti-sigma factor) [Thalassobacillus cyri]|uniref:Anti-anti-sigma regulatory factor (Antagonist of anti-sigma factor) n=2 Tax=Thalassobacillus cyri TaxID=571932 RepID=A0A1H4EZX8_9BACI|nr:Anti-anti-sigma regulatory factor (antagonist of anti-sigma factor) [Thalassobacillus cyri]
MISMKGNGEIPDNISLLNTLNSIGENILIADKDYHVTWMNDNALGLFAAIAPLYGLERAEDVIGMNMDQFHENPGFQRKIMAHIENTHRARINIRNNFVADIVVTPIKNEEESIDGYVVMLMDVTTRAEEEARKDKLIEELSTPLIKIWDKTIAVPLIGMFDRERSEQLTSIILKACASADIEYALIDLSGMHTFDEGISHQIQQLNNSLTLIGTECIIVGITPKLAMTFEILNNEIATFRNAHAGLEYIIKKSGQN